MGSYAELVKMIIYALSAFIALSTAGYAVYSYVDGKMEKERTAYRSVIAKEHIEKETMKVKETERRSAAAFEKIEQKIDTDSSESRAYTKEKIDDKNTTDFTDTF